MKICIDSLETSNLKKHKIETYRNTTETLALQWYKQKEFHKCETKLDYTANFMEG